MSTPGILLRRRNRRRPSAAPRRRIVDVTNTWRVDGAVRARRVIVREPDGSLTEQYLPDEHPALVRHLDRLQAAAVAA